MRQIENVVVGAGLVGSLLAIFLRQHGQSVTVFEKRPDMRISEVNGGRSINLVITSRGLHALEQVGLRSSILSMTTPVFGRMIHDISGARNYQSYSKDNTACNYSVSRAQLNQALMTCAEQAGAVICFDQELQDISWQTGRLHFSQEQVQAQRIFATDGAGSKVRQCLVQQGLVTEQIHFLSHGYKELEIPPASDGSPVLSKDALHIWPRGHHMMMALPNQDNSFTVTLYLPHQGEISFANLTTPSALLSYFQTFYPDAIPLIPRLHQDFFGNPTGLLATVWASPWFLQDKILLLGDAAHGVVPFFGQGMNAGFEDCVVLQSLIESKGWNEPWFSDFFQQQKPNADAIARMALQNFVEMRESVGDAQFLLEKQVEGILGRTYPDIYLSKYSMVTHSLIPYHIAEQVGHLQTQILRELCAGLDRAEHVDLHQAKRLLQDKLVPYLQQNQVHW